MKNRTAMLVLAGAVVFASSIGAVAGCLSLSRGGSNVGDGGAGALGTPSASATPSADASPADTESPPTRKPTTRKTTRPPEETGPRIVYFRIAQQPRCPQGTSEYPVEGVPVILEWKVTGAHEATVSVDGEGIYKTYETEGSDEINFPCGGQPGETVTHTYKLKTVGGGSVRSRTLTASAEVYEVATV